VASAIPRGIPVFSVVIAYEDFATGNEAKRACDFVSASFTHHWRVLSQMWKFDLLEVAELRELAAQDAALADLIIVACHHDHELPAGVKAWIETWRAYKAEAVGLIGLFDCPPGQAKDGRATQNYLKHVAQQSHMQFLIAQVRAQIS
jgi:hypothetical protein